MSAVRSLLPPKAPRWLPLLLLLGCTRPSCSAEQGRRAPPRPAPASTDGGDEDRARALAGLAVEEWNAELHFSPVTATWLGDHRFDDRLNDVRPEAEAREVARLRSVRDRLAQLSAGLGPAGGRDDLRLDLRLLAERVELRLQELSDTGPLYYMNLLAYGVDGMLGPDFLPVEALPLRVLARRLSQVPPLCQEAMRNLKNPPEPATRKAIEIGQATQEFLSTLLPRLVRGVADMKALEEFRKSNDDARRALEEFLGFLSREVLPRSRGDYALGRERLLARLRAAEQLDVPLEALQALGEREVRETRHRLEEIARRLIGGGGSGARLLAEAQRTLEEDHPKAEELLQVAGAIVDSVYEAVREGGAFPLPAERPRVEEMPPHRWGFAQLYSPGPLETRPFEPRFYVDPVDPVWVRDKDRKRVSEHLRYLNRSQLTLTVLHEIAPGHFTQQTQHRAALGELSATRQRARSAALIEGWPHYAVDLMLQTQSTQLPERDRLLFLLWRGQLLHLGRLVVALRLHGVAGPPGAGGFAAGMARLEDAARYLMDECLMEDYAAHREAERATYDPFFLLPALGRLQLAKLRTDYLEEHGEGATTRAFHAELLKQGELPVVSLRQLLLQKPGKSL